MKTYRVDHPEKGEITYSDKKRYLWISSVFYPLIPLFFIYQFLMTGNELVLATPLLIGYVVFPLLDWMIGSDTNNPPEEIVPLLEEDRYYRVLTYLTIPMHFIVLFSCAWVVGTQSLSSAMVIVMAIIAGGDSGIGINTGHELGHKNTKLEQWLSKIVLAVPAYAHFSIEHNKGHHKHVSTPEDPASSRMGESIYAFTLREIPGTMRRGWALEKERLIKEHKGIWSHHNEILQSYTLTAIIQLSLLAYFGWIVLPFLIIHNFWAWFQLTSANYIEHYGLLREKKANGNYERCKPHHSWNTNYIMSNVALFHLERHSDHHAYPARRYQSLRNFDDIPELPNGYFGMYLLAYFPPLWFSVMDKKVLALPHIQGDLSKVNICPKHRNALLKKYS
jgi:alkane 1-monooxygenase